MSEELREPGLRKFSRLRGRFELQDGIKLLERGVNPLV